MNRAKALLSVLINLGVALIIFMLMVYAVIIFEIYFIIIIGIASIGLICYFNYKELLEEGEQ